MSARFFKQAGMAMGLFLGLSAAWAEIPNTVTFRNHFGSMTFNRPVLAMPFPGEDSVFLVLQQNGRILTVQRLGSSWVKTDSASVTVNGGTSGGSEQGLLGFAFHPNYRVNRKYYIYYIAGSSAGFDMVAERTADVSLRPKTADPQRTLLRITDPYVNHNGGTIAFGSDGYLYVGIGDGGDAGDPGNRAQNKGEMLGKIHRLDVDGPDAFPSDTTRNYAIPAGNPFVDTAGARPEIWAYGLRNPWKWSFHPVTGDLWVGDVGQNLYEEVSLVPKGGNMGWRLREGAFCYNPSTNCPSAGLVSPAITMQRSQAASITGGVFFVGNPSSAFHETYVFGDYVTNNVWAVRYSSSSGRFFDSTRIGSVTNVVSFDRDARGNVLAVSLGTPNGNAGNNTGIVYILESPDMVAASVPIRSGGRNAARPLSAGDLLRHPDKYELYGLDGKAIPGQFSGIALARERGIPRTPRLVSLIR